MTNKTRKLTMKVDHEKLYSQIKEFRIGKIDPLPHILPEPYTAIICEACGYEIDPADEEVAKCYECGATIHSDCRKRQINYHGCGKCI